MRVTRLQRAQVNKCSDVTSIKKSYSTKEHSTSCYRQTRSQHLRLHSITRNQARRRSENDHSSRTIASVKLVDKKQCSCTMLSSLRRRLINKELLIDWHVWRRITSKRFIPRFWRDGEELSSHIKRSVFFVLKSEARWIRQICSNFWVVINYRFKMQSAWFFSTRIIRRLSQEQSYDSRAISDHEKILIWTTS